MSVIATELSVLSDRIKAAKALLRDAVNVRKAAEEKLTKALDVERSCRQDFSKARMAFLVEAGCEIELEDDIAWTVTGVHR